MAKNGVAPPKRAVAWQVAGATTPGASHVRKGLRNQDCLRQWVQDGRPGANALVAVSDGHGSARHFRSHVGAQLAVDAAEAVFREILRDAGRSQVTPPGEGDPSRLLARRLVDIWRENVRAHLLAHPFEESEWAALADAEPPDAREAVQADPFLAYGATVLAVMTTETRLIYLQLGDGDILNVDASGHTTPAMPEDRRLIANRTTSLCLPNAFQEFRCRVEGIPQAPALVLLSTDGYANSFKTYEDFTLIGRDYLRLVREKGVEALSRDLPAILADASASGSGDDITLGMLVRIGPQSDPSPASAVKPPALEQVAADLRMQQLKLECLQTRFDALSQRVTRVGVWAAVLFLCGVLGTGAFLLRRHLTPGGQGTDPGQPGQQQSTEDPRGPRRQSGRQGDRAAPGSEDAPEAPRRGAR